MPLRLLDVINRTQSAFIADADDRGTFETLLADLLELTGSRYGFVSEIVSVPGQPPRLKPWAIRHSPPLAHDDAPDEPCQPGTLLAEALRHGKPVIANAPDESLHRSGLPQGHPPLDSCLAIPIQARGKQVALMGLANRQGGYDPALAEFLQPLAIIIGQLVEARRQDAARRRDEARLKKLSAILENADVGSWEWNLQTGETAFNERWAEMLGCTLAELEPVSIDTWRDLTHPEDIGQATALLEQLIAGTAARYETEFRMRHKDGHWVWVLTRGKVQSSSADGKPLLLSGIHINITRRKQAELALQEQTQRLESIIEGTDAGTWEWNAHTGSVHFSERWAGMLGYTLEELSPTSPNTTMSLTHPEDIPRVRQTLEQHFTGKSAYYECEFRMRHKDGHWVWVLARGKATQRQANGLPLLMSGTHLDITPRKLAEESLKDSQYKLSALYQLSPLGIALTRAEDGRFSEGNPALFRMTGYTEQEFRSTALARISPPEYDASDREASNTVSTTGSYGPYEKELIHKDGHRIPVLLNGARMVNPDGVAMIWTTIQDISARREQERKTQELNERLQNISGQVPGVVYQFLMRGDGSFCFPYASERMRDIYRLSPEAVIEDATLVFDAVHPNDLQSVRESILASAKTLQPWQHEYRVRFPDGDIRWLSGHATPTRHAEGGVLWHGFITDITARKQAEAQSAHTAALLHDVLESASEVSIIATDPEGIITVFNTGAERLLGYRAAEMLGIHTPAIFHLRHEIVARSNELTVEMGRPIEGFGVFVTKPALEGAEQREWTYVRKDGSHVPVALVITAMRNAQQDIIGYLGIAQDITERKRIEQMKTDFVSTVSHELRTPLTSIAGSLGLLASDSLGELSPDARRLVEIAHKNSQRLTLLINDLLDMEKIVAGKMRFDIRAQAVMPLVEQALEATQSYADQFRVRFTITRKMRSGMLAVDGARLQQVLVNLLSNAAKFSPPGDMVEVAVYRNGRRVRMEVRDHGPGIPDEFRPRIFQKFSQSDTSNARKKGGTGLGLAISKQLVERMNGHIGFESEPGHGTTFFVELPLLRTHSPTPQASPVEE